MVRRDEKREKAASSAALEGGAEGVKDETKIF